MTNPHQTNSVEEVVEDFVNWYFGKREHWSTHDETRAKLMAEKLTTLVEQARGEPSLLSFGYHKGEMDFGVNGTVTELTYEQMKELREMIVVGIGQLESMWRDSRPNPAARTISSDSKNV